MAKQKDGNLKPLYSRHLEELLSDKKMTKKKLAELLYTTPQTISKACNGIRLSKGTALAIVDLFPEYNLSWVLGQDTTKFVADIEEEKRKAEKERLLQGVKTVIQHLDNIFAVCADAGYSMTWDLQNISVRDIKTGKELVLTLDEFSEFHEDFATFLVIRLEKLMERGH